MAIITIGGLTGSGGRHIGKAVAEKLGFDYIDRLILSEAAKQIGSTVQAMQEKEDQYNSVLENISSLAQRILERSAMSGVGGDPHFGPGAAAFLINEQVDFPKATILKGSHMENSDYIDGLTSVIVDIAKNDNAVIVGRGAAAILKDDKSVLKIGLNSSKEDRIKRISQRENIDKTLAEKIVNEKDAARVDFYKTFFEYNGPEDPRQFHLSINTTLIKLDPTISMILAAAKAFKEGLLTH
ncbi:MAG: cytidylate kinase-like family protein [SAR202 cluster bacterium]|nr:cytidylate kinase-like family protein [SAR202 cluster bacterium]